MKKINIDKLDDIQLAMYLAQKNNKGQPTLIIKREAESILEWIRDKRNPSEKKQEPTVESFTEEELLFNKSVAEEKLLLKYLIDDKCKPEQFNYPHWSL